MGFGPQIENVTRESQATPLAEDVLQSLRGQLAEGSFGQGVGPLQRQGSNAVSQYLNHLQGVAAGGSTPLIDALTRLHGRQTERGAANVKEQMGVAGAAAGSSLADALSLYQAEQDAAFDVTAANSLMQQEQMLLNAANMLFDMGQLNIQPFLQMAQLGIIPEEIVASPGLGSQLLTAGANTLGAYFGSGGRLPFGGGGGGGGPMSMAPPPSVPQPNPGGPFLGQPVQRIP